jgi:hypothetical protein
MAWAAVCVLALVAPAAQAHHSMAMFDNTKEVKISGKVRAFQWTNPHAYIQLVSRDGSGKSAEWSLEMGAPMYLYARGWRPGTLKAGSDVVVTIHPLRNGHPGGVVLDVTTPDGKKIGGKV